jgi:CRISPR type III-A-associated RAMP protein Csm4
LQALIHTLLEIIGDEGIGGAISTGCGTLESVEVQQENFIFNFENGQASKAFQVSMSLIVPQSKTELEQLQAYKVTVRGGRKLASGETLYRVKMIEEGAMMPSTTKGNIVALHPTEPYLRNGKAFGIPVHEHYVDTNLLKV